MPRRSLVLVAGVLATSSALSPAVAPAMRVGGMRVAQRPRFATSIRMQESFPTLEEELEAGNIPQEEYDELMTGIDESELEAEPEPELSDEAARIMRGMTSATGVEFAPWMKVDAEKIAQAKKEREERMRKAKANAGRQDPMQIDPQAAELGAGGGLKSKTLSEEEVELRWDTTDEAGNKGFIVQRRRGGAPNFEDLESFEGFAPLRSKGPAGGSYVYLDDSADVGTWVYRILDCDEKDQRSAVCQKLVEIESKDEQQFTFVVGAVIAGLAAVLVIAGIVSDPIQTTAKGSALF